MQVLLSSKFPIHTFTKQMPQVAMAGSTRTISSTFDTSPPQSPFHKGQLLRRALIKQIFEGLPQTYADLEKSCFRLKMLSCHRNLKVDVTKMKINQLNWKLQDNIAFALSWPFLSQTRIFQDLAPYLQVWDARQCLYCVTAWALHCEGGLHIM